MKDREKEQVREKRVNKTVKAKAQPNSSEVGSNNKIKEYGGWGVRWWRGKGRRNFLLWVHNAMGPRWTTAGSSLLEKDAWPTNRASTRGRKKHREGYIRRCHMLTEFPTGQI